jgi:hypothetical protein
VLRAKLGRLAAGDKTRRIALERRKKTLWGREILLPVADLLLVQAVAAGRLADLLLAGC